MPHISNFHNFLKITKCPKWEKTKKHLTSRMTVTKDTSNSGHCGLEDYHNSLLSNPDPQIWKIFSIKQDGSFSIRNQVA